MAVTITFRHMEPDDNIKFYVREKFERFKRYVEDPLEIHTVITFERKYIYRIDVMLVLNGIVINAHEAKNECFTAIDMIVDKLERRLKRYREKLKRYKEEKLSQEKMGPEKEKEILFTKKVEAKPMDIEEALLQLKASRNSFMVFRERERGNICLIYKRKDGKFSLIET